MITALEKLTLTPAECAMLGDTVYDAQACRGAGVVYANLDRALETASLPATASH